MVSPWHKSKKRWEIYTIYAIVVNFLTKLVKFCIILIIKQI